MRQSLVVLVALLAACSSASEPTKQTETPTPKLLTAHVAASDTSAFQPGAPQDTFVRRVIPPTALIFKIDSVREHKLLDTTSLLLRYWHPAQRLSFISKIGPIPPIADSSSYIAIDTVSAVFEIEFKAMGVFRDGDGAFDWGVMDGASLIGAYAWQTFHYNHATVVGSAVTISDRNNQPLIVGHRVN